MLMIDVNIVKKTADELARGQAGAYASGDEFNRLQRQAQSWLFDYYIQTWESTGYESLLPFLRTKSIGVSAGEFSMPSDVRKIARVEVEEISGGAVAKTHPCIFIPTISKGSASASALRSANVAKTRYYYSPSGQNKFWVGKEVSQVKVTYFVNIPDAVWGFTLDATNVVENYNAATSVHFEWPVKDQDNLVDIFLFLRGLQTKQSDIINWLMAKKQY